MTGTEDARRGHVCEGPPAAAGTVAAAAFRPAGAALSRRLNCATVLLDDAIAEGHGDRPAILTEAGSISYRELLARANRIANVLRGRGRRAGQPRAAARLQRPGAVRRLARRHEGGRDRGHDHADAARARTDRDHRQGPAGVRALRPPAARRAGTAVGGDGQRRHDHQLGRRRPRGPHGGGRRTASATWTRLPTTSACWPSLPARPASRRPACISTATCSRWPMSSRGTCCRRGPDDVYAGSPPLGFTFGLGACWCSRCVSARRSRPWKRRHRRHCSRQSSSEPRSITWGSRATSAIEYTGAIAASDTASNSASTSPCVGGDVL